MLFYEGLSGTHVHMAGIYYIVVEIHNLALIMKYTWIVLANALGGTKYNMLCIVICCHIDMHLKSAVTAKPWAKWRCLVAAYADFYGFKCVMVIWVTWLSHMWPP